MTDNHILTTVSDGVSTITINRPDSYNALRVATIHELIAAFKAVAKDKTIRAVVITGAGKGFCSGADLTEFGGRPDDVDITEILRSRLNVLVTQMRSLEVPIVGAVNGVAAGAGASLALAADYRLASDRASFVFAAFVNIGLIPDAGATYLLQRLVGQARAFELAILADNQNRVDADAARAFGVVNQVVPHERLAETAATLAGKLAAMPTRAIGLTKRAIYGASERSLAEALDVEAQLQGAAFATYDFREGVAAFIEKRSPSFKGE